MDTVNKETRSRMMASVRARNTKLEMEVRRRLFAMGFRYRLHVKSIPGTPDMVFPKYGAVLFVHGCFWHFHNCSRSSIPETRKEWWQKKLEDNRARDTRALSELRSMGWRVLVIWECAVRRTSINHEDALEKISMCAEHFLQSKRKFLEISGSNRAGLMEGKSV